MTRIIRGLIGINSGRSKKKIKVCTPLAKKGKAKLQKNSVQRDTIK